ncbi:MAG: ShlB/FhaC/HecB family hemolysin secretion/activation protein [Nitrospina sp.]|nr:MAG: ShlB/FhaC/HecB family hemolysin secretion/activation protein [Nitrospina sp.]
MIKKYSQNYDGLHLIRLGYLLIFIFMMQALVRPALVGAQVPIPPPAEPGIIEKSLEQSRPEFQPPPEQKIPEISIDHGREVIDAGAGPTFLVRRIEIEGNTVIDNATLAPLIDVGKEGTEMTLGVLNLYAQEVTTFYNTRGYFLARAHFPPQKIQDGVVKMKIVEGTIGEIRVTGNKRTDSADLIERMEPIKLEKVLREETLLRPLLELNDVLGLEVKSVLKPGHAYGTSDLVLHVKESRPYYFAFDVDNFGSSFTGRTRFGITANVGSLLTFNDLFSVRGVISDGNQDFIQTSYRIPLNHAGTTFAVAYIYSDYILGKSLTPIDAKGTTNILSFELAQALHRTRTSQWGLVLGVDYRFYENEQLGFVTSEDELVDIFIGVGGNFRDEFLGRNFLNLKLTQGLKRADPNRTLKSRIGGEGDVLISNLNLIRYQSTQVLKSYFSMQVSGQLVSSRVLSPDQFVIGGIGTVRGYPLAEASQDNGYALTLEYVLPFPWKWSVGFGKTLDKMLSLVGFLDHGRVFVRDPQLGGKNQDLTGAGGGIRIHVPPSNPSWPALSFACMYGAPVGDPTPSERSNGFLYLSGRISY